MRKAAIAIIATLALAVAGGVTLVAQSPDIQVNVVSRPADVRVSSEGSLVSMAPAADAPADFTLVRDPGRPALPARVVQVLLPAGRRFESVEARSRRSSRIAAGATLAIESPPSAGPGSTGPATADPEPVAPDDGGAVFPSSLVRYLGSGTWHGYTIASFAVFVTRVEGGDIILHEDIELRVDTGPADARETLRPARLTASAAGALGAELRRRVANPGESGSYAPIRVARAGGPFAPTGVPSLEGSPVEYVIVTTEAMRPSFEVLADWKTARGVPTVVRTVEWIESNYRRGTDRSETVRFFVQDAYTKWGIQWLLLAGDTGEIPARYLYSTYYYGGTQIPCDLYFGGVDGNFNADGDDRFGEQPADTPDLYTEIFVGRLPVSTPAAAATMVSKIMAYETPADPEYTDKVLHLSEVLFPAPWSPPQTILQNGADISEYLNTIYVADPSRRVTRCYETNWLFPGSVLETRLIAIDSLEAGYNQVFHIGHGYRFNMHCGDDNVAITDADALYHPDRCFNLYMLNCTAAAFDFDCLGEHLLRNPDGGAVSVVGAANSAFADISAFYMEDYVARLYEDSVVNVGATLATSRALRTPFALLGDNGDLWTHYIYALLADPEMPMWTAAAEFPQVTHAASVAAGSNHLAVEVTVGGLPRPDATVCLWKDGEDYQVGVTDLAGQAEFDFNTPTPGTISVVVSGMNLARTADTITVDPAGGAVLAIDTVFVDDDAAGGTSGNGDGRIDAGEIVDLLPLARNTGGTPSAAAVATLSASTPGVTVLQNNAALPAIAAGAQAQASGPWRVQVAASATDESAARFAVVMDDGNTSWNASFAKVVHAPELELVALRRSDQAPVGNGDGTITAGEQFLLYATLKNYGTGTAGGLSAVLRALDAGASVSDSTASFADLAHLAAGESPSGFQLAETSVAVANPLEISVSDAHGRSWTFPVEMRLPAAPVIQSFDASLGVDKMRVVWSPGPSSDAAGYHVYRSTAPAGPYTRASADIVRHTVFTDSGLLPSTRYYYRITTVDASGNESAPSASSFASTNAPQLPGWPNELVAPSANSPAIGDVDGNGMLDVVVGNDRLYAWRADGIEMIDGDGQALTWGVYSPLGQDFVGPAALARLDGNTGLDIVAAAYTSKEVYCFTENGGVLPGWPKPTVDFVRAGTAVGDIDGDGQPEIIAVDQDAYLYAWNVDGTEVFDGDANPATQGVLRRLPDTNQWQYQMPSLADLDGDGREEIVIATQDKKVYVLNETGGDEPGWPFTLPNYAGGGAAIGDIDGNGDLEIVVTTRNTGETYALHHNGTQMWLRWLPQNLFFNPSPALADITGDGKLEALIASSNGRLYCVQYNGADAPGWPQYYSTTTYTESSPVVADVDGDGSVDILLGHEGKYINAWSSAGVLLDGFPLVTKDAVRGTPAVTDLDGDGDVEIVAVGYDRVVYAWSLPVPFDPALAPWPMFKANAHRNGLHGYVVATAAGGGGNDRPRELRLEQNHPNPFNPVTRIAWDLAGRAPERVSLTIYDVRGARVRALVDGVVKPGRYSTTWDGRNDRGEHVSSGVYFYRLSTPARALTRKMVLLK
jgi:chitodextrinase